MKRSISDTPGRKVHLLSTPVRPALDPEDASGLPLGESGPWLPSGFLRGLRGLPGEVAGKQYWTQRPVADVGTPEAAEVWVGAWH